MDSSRLQKKDPCLIMKNQCTIMINYYENFIVKEDEETLVINQDEPIKIEELLRLDKNLSLPYLRKTQSILLITIFN